jgi:hypothetical protein
MFILENARQRGWFSRAVRSGMITTRTGDLVPILIMGRTLYNQAFQEAKNRGLSDSQSAKYAEFIFGSLSDQTQQSSAWKDRTHWQRSGNLGELLSMFQTSPRQYLTVGIRAIQKARAQKTGESQLKAAKTFFIMFGLLPAAFTFAKNVFSFNILGRDDDRDEEEIWLDYLAAMIKSPLGGVFMVRYISDNVIDRVVIGKYRFGGEDVPILGLDQDVIRLYDSVYGIATSDGDAGEIIEQIGKSVPAVKQATEIIENRN